MCLGSPCNFILIAHMDLQVELRPPYGLSNCSTENSTDLATLERVKKVVRAVNLMSWNLACTCQINGLIPKTWLAVDG